MTTLVTGGAGFVFSHVVDQLLTMKQNVRVLDNFSTGKIENLRTRPNLEIVRGDVRDKQMVRQCVRDCDWVIHGAAMARIQPSLTNPQETFDINIGGTINILEAAREFGVKRVVFAGSSSVYGMNAVPNSENMIPDCLSPYSYSKKAGEELLSLYNKVYGLSTCSLRFFNVYGPRHIHDGDYATVIAIFREQKRLNKKLTVVGDGSKRRDMTNVSDVVNAVIKAAMNYSAIGVYNVGTGINYSILEVAKIIAEGDDSKIEFIPDRPAEAQVTLADIRKIKNDLGWSPTIDLQQGLAIIDLYEKLNPPKGRIILL